MRPAPEPRETGMKPLPPHPLEEPPAADEEQLVTRLIAVIEALIDKTHRTGTTYRDTHAKGHGAVRATFTVEDGLAAELRVGLFATPRTYPAWVRLSSLSPQPQPDARRDVRALSIKLMEVDGELLWQSEPGARTLDLILMAWPTFLAPDLPTFHAMEVAILRGGAAAGWFFLTHPRVLSAVVRSRRRTASLLEIAYWSQTAYALGERAVQYHLRPHQPATSAPPARPSPDYLRERLSEDLRQRPAAFDFMVQLQVDPRRTPVDDPMVAWDPALSPFRKVATLRLPVQSFDSPAQRRFCENLSFNPWRTLPEHRPLGAINRARRRVYPAISALRHRRNDAREREPRPRDPSF